MNRHAAISFLTAVVCTEQPVCAVDLLAHVRALYDLTTDNRGQFCGDSIFGQVAVHSHIFFRSDGNFTNGAG